MLYWPAASFWTWTYSDEHLPADGSLKSEQYTLAIKRLRERLRRSKRPMAYFGAGEYGERYGRPHYHTIILGVSRDESELMREVWPYGYVDSGTVTYESIRYVVDYIGKVDANGWQDERERPFRRMSKGLGKRWIEDESNLRRLLIDPTIRYRGKEFCLPRYFIKKMKDVYSKEFVDLILKDLDREKKEVYFEAMADYALQGEVRCKYDFDLINGAQRDLNLNARLNLKKKGVF